MPETSNLVPDLRRSARPTTLRAFVRLRRRARAMGIERPLAQITWPRGVWTGVVLLIAVYGFLTERPEFLDIALVYALINFIGTIAVCKYVSFSNLGYSARDDEVGDV